MPNSADAAGATQLTASSHRALESPSAIRSRLPGRPSREEAEALRQDILDAALATFIVRGFEAASMQGIARKANVTKMTLYRQFETKETLFIAVARQAQLSVRNNLGTMVGEGSPLQKVLREIIEKLYDGYTDPKYIAVSRMVIAEAENFPKLGRAMLNDSKYVIEPLVDYLNDLKNTGQINIDSAYDAATQIAGMASGAGRYVLVTPSREDSSRKRWVNSLVTLFTQAWRVGPI